MFRKTCFQTLDEPILVWWGLTDDQIKVIVGVGLGSALLGMLLIGFFGVPRESFLVSTEGH